MTFKIGDKVRLVDNSDLRYSNVKKEDIGVILDKPHWNKAGWLVVRVNGYNKGMSIYDKRWELVEDKLNKLKEKLIGGKDGV